MSSVSPPQVFNVTEPIPGYRVVSRLGAGGYGEVWKAEAPGGIAKAVKVVFGYHDDERAQRELNALNRIKEVRHPFLLSLERIEHVDGHLVIVAELATGSLKDLFNEYRQAGQPGIPRGEILSHLQDAADALDYICQEHSLQHLDVKPENLLLVGGRIKVADFGLVKDLQDVNSSIVGGLTPVYAAPELFDGRPNIHSDQYSLAIVYQEMLTGVLPYEGRTTAQLAAQHLHSRPRLDRLPASDQPTIARALSKDPQQRFPSCRDMVDSLLETTPNHRPRAPKTPARTGGFCAPQVAHADTEVISWGGVPANAGSSSAPATFLTQPLEHVRAVCDLPPLELQPEDTEYRPTVFVGIGGLAARTLQALQRRLVDRFGDIRSVPALQLLLLETDAETLRAITEGEGPGSLCNDSTVLLPLRQPADYRGELGNRLHWLSRRWIYNIPRSAQTQSFRPLGRLAFVDHMERVMERVGRAIKTAVDPAGLAASAEITGLPFRKTAPRVFLVSSISGGTGGGMVLDVAYVVRKTLRDLGLSEEGICGLLAYCTGRNPQTRDLGVANAYAFLNEFIRYSDLCHGYPGDPACGLPAFTAEDAPFHHSYVVHLGEELEQDGFAAATEKLAQYLYCNAVTPAVAFFDKCRAAQSPETPPTSDDPMVRTFGLCQLGFSYDDIPPTAIAELCGTLLARWRSVDDVEPDNRPTCLSDPTSLVASQVANGQSEKELRAEVTSRAETMELHVEGLLERLNAAVLREMGNDPESYLMAVLGEMLHKTEVTARSMTRLPPGKVILDALDAMIRSEGEQDASHVCLESVLETYLKDIASSHGTTLREWILGLVNSPKHRVAGAQHAADLVAEHLRTLSHRAGELSKSMLREACSLRETLLADKSGSRDWLRARGFVFGRKLTADRRLSQYFRFKIAELTLNAVCRLISLILGQVNLLGDKLRNLAADLNRIAEQCQDGEHPTVDGKSPATEHPKAAQGLAAEAIRNHKAALLAEMEILLEEKLRWAATTESNDVRSTLLQRLHSTARSLILRLFQDVTLREIKVSGEGKPSDSIFSLGAGAKAADPRLSDCGGARRLLLIAPGSTASVQLVEQLGDGIRELPTVVTDAENDVILCYEGEQVPLRQVAATVLDQRPQIADIASRLHTRIDVPWSTP